MNPLKIDSHQHVFWLGRDDRWLIGEMDELGIDVAWLLTWYLSPQENDPSYHRNTSPVHARADGTHAAMPLVDVVTACRRYPGRFIPGYCPDPTLPSALQLFESAYHIHGVRVCGEWSYRTLLDDPRSIELFRKVGELNCPVVLHMDVPYLPDGKGGRGYQWRWYGGTVENLERALQACPETIFIGHSPGFWREISGDADARPETYPDGPVTPNGRLIRLFNEYPNLWGDLSAGSGLNAMQRDLDHAMPFIGKNADRLLFGRDQYGNDLDTFLQSLNLPDDIAEKVYSGNALKLIPMECAQS
ncbi:MAG: hypothetical protein COS85_16660 [Armatimonadetes bacterium CG07_land_8_20_14_0_80_59_28]|nr:MAG: hypothetical protein COS85_16660 [Armatimonadetes bacterium CG07_land_8_20_14_0_80_59_28]PIX43176.1 MAG: hypothetical protein COZ56_07815 [Armatimonadetes bacterium CG_4_8_14_3_um_filter_58_9]PIY43641.1 MAG: hypothetical protein COZ05_10365 [Armatimonadetes bacterium CG_4_10_14_3_um_filter_59_10]